jgi:hypothetical protein
MNARKLILYIIFLVVLAVAAYTIIVVIPTQLAERSYEGAKQLGRDIEEAFNFTPEVTVNNTVVLQQQTAIFELATLSQKFEHRYNWKNTWMGSTKEIRITGTFDAKVGFELNKRFAIQIEEEKAIVVLPVPIILSLEPLGDMKFEDENGVWNWVNNQDRSAAVNSFQLDARKYALEADFVEQGKVEAEKKITEVLKMHVKDVEFRYATEPVRIEKQ